MSSRVRLAVIVSVSLLLLSLEAKKAVDPYKVLGVDRNASQRDIKKAFHKLSLQYHPDKNKNKGSQAKFEEINNAYEILSDEDKRKNYDLYGDERGGPSFEGGNAGDYGGYTYFTGGGPGQSGWQSSGGKGKSQSFSFSFGGPSSGNSFGGFGLDDIFSNLFSGEAGSGGGGFNFGGFGGSSGSHRGGFQGSAGSKSSSRGSLKPVKTVTSQLFENEIYDKGIGWVLVSYSPLVRMNPHQDLILEEVADSLKSALKVGKINCGKEESFCKSHGISPRRAPRLFVYSYVKSNRGSFIEYNDKWDVKALKSFCREHIPRFSKRISIDGQELTLDAGEGLPKILLLSSRKDTPIIWRVLSGLYRKRFNFYDTQVQDISNPKVKRMGVDLLPAIVGWLPNGEQQILKTGISVKDLESAVQDLSRLLDSFERKYKKAASSSSKPKKPKTESSAEGVVIPLLTVSNFNSVCGDSSPVCIVGVFRSLKSRRKLESLLSIVAQKSLTRRQSHSSSSSDSRDVVTYALLDGSKQHGFLTAFDKSGFQSLNELLLAYKPRRGKHASLKSDLNPEEVEKFVSSVLSGDVQFSKTRHKPAVE